MSYPWSGRHCLLLPAACLPPPLTLTDNTAPAQRAPPRSPLLSQLCGALAPFPHSLKVAHVNAQSLFCHIDEFRTIFQSSDVDIVLVSESWLKPNLNDKSIELFGYNIYRNDRLHRGGGGVAVYVKSHFQSVLLFSSDTTRAARPEYMFLDICVNKTHFLICVCYRAPGIGFLAEFERDLVSLLPRYGHVVVMGDFNSDLLGPPTYDQRSLTSMFYSCGMTVLPLQATHHTATADTLLDLIVVSDPALIAHHGQFPAPGLSKHDLIFCIYKLKQPKPGPQFIKYRDFKNLNHNALLHDAFNMSWHEITQAPDVDTMINKFNLYMTNLYNKHCPIVSKRISKPPAPWLTDYIRQLQRQRDSAFRKAKRTKVQLDWASYKRLRNYTQQQIRNSKARFYYQSFAQKQSTKVLWTKLKNLGIGKSVKSSQVPFSLNSVNKFFVNIPVDATGARDFVAELESSPLHIPANKFSFSPVNDSDVYKSIMRMTSNAVGADDISISFVKETLPVTLPVITLIFNKSLSTNCFPSVWKSALVRPLQKTSSPNTLSDYRPISILSALSKCLERLVQHQFSLYIEQHSILTNYQSGFRPNYSTTTALLKITDDIRLAMDKTQATILTLFDFSRAFDCVYHPLLYIKLRIAGFSDGCVDWVMSYLSDRQQCVKIGDESSAWMPVTRGVPQGSVLGPLLFLLYINDITDHISHSRFHLYADDLQIYSHFSVCDMETTVQQMNSDIDSIIQWTNKNGLKLNVNKTHAIVVGYPRLLTKINFLTAPRLRVDGSAIEYCDKVKNLGVYLNKHLGWTDQVNATCSRVFAAVHSIKRFVGYLPLNVRVMLVKTLVLSHFNYCDVVISDMTVKLSDRLQRAQNYCIQYIFGLRRNDHVTPYFNLLSLMKLSELREFHTLCLLYSVINSDIPKYLSNNFLFMRDISSRVTRRGSHLLTIPIHRTTVYNKSFVVTAARLWNSLPDNIKNIDQRARFGAEVKATLLGRGGRG